MRVFVSSENIDRPPVPKLLKRLLREGWLVLHSPRNPAEGADPRWSDWYKRGCQAAVEQADVFIAVVTRTWESTWMAHESEVALQCSEERHVPRCYYWNPDGVEVHAAGLLPYLRARLPDDLEAAMAVLRDCVANPGPP